ncbi:17-beta-hydroxysteroid dehydrogenase type 6-like [Alligator sinensis]|uniref:17-beta-hydroxysteroid dehydrogenase type 6-like n=1 Tax=Alligator sinensis TaxID=38654 RepID=A0A3Q0FNA6_ALLSI|nr:17-beta-hydroxysteroid dehydrogenase type 6-like [Alligator sinensis]
MWLYLAALLVLYILCLWYRERQVVGNLPDKHVFITGCDSGFGHLLAKQLDGRGLRGPSGRRQTVILDVTCSDSIAAASAWVKGQVGDRGLWGLVNNAGSRTPIIPNEWLSKADFVKVLDVYLVGLSLLPLVRRARGRIASVTSAAGQLSITGGGYCPAKYGMEAFSDSLRRELCNFAVKVSIIEPGGFRTPILEARCIRKSLEQVWSCALTEVKEAYGQQYFDRYSETTRKLILILPSDNLRLVTDAMEHALTAQHPRTRYSCGWVAKLLSLPLSYLPTSWAGLALTCSQPKPALGI